ncbi:uncharacterized protein LOC110176485 [Drosophila serrata]|uniref:uncharacterized protein LOC110176485 n=1 Tax=Drosophila serrata TaxID=7274 RepID=UPI000A1D017A|nr:uncharacterized protein LOC110176485 [Drosophila serrata]
MMSKRSLLIAGLLLIVGCSTVLSFPQGLTDEEMQNDDFTYDDDDSAPSPQTKATSPASPSEKVNKTLTATGIRGEDLVLKCDLDSNVLAKSVILWYFGENIIANGKSLLLSNFELDSNNDLIILKASPKDAGIYHCLAVPSNSVVYTKVSIAEHSLDAIAPESSTSTAGSGSASSSLLLGWTLLVLLGIIKH